MQPDPFLQDLPTPQKVLVILAHPDDAEFFAGGTLAKWAQAGAEISLLLITSGDKGSGDLNVLNPATMVSIREAEARAAAECLGMKEVIFLRHQDGTLSPSLELRRHIVRMIRLKRPDTVMSSDPLLRWRGSNRINHPDHYSVAEAVQSAVYPAARDHLNFVELFVDEGLAPHKVEWLYMALALQPNYCVDISAFRSLQIEALKCHRSQIGEPAAFEERMRARHDPEPGEDGRPRYTEYFRVIQLS